MKKIFLFFLLIFWPLPVYAEDLLLKNVNIKNGELSLEFDAYNTEYTVTIAPEEYTLDLEYVVDDGVTVALNNNHDLNNDSVVTLTLIKDKEQVDYHFHILKDNEETIKTFNETPKVVENNFMYKYKLYIIPSICLLLIYICYKILFHKHKKKII